MAIVDTGAEPVDVLHVTYLVSDDGTQAIEFPEPLVVVIGPGSLVARPRQLQIPATELTAAVTTQRIAAEVRQA